MSRTIKIQIPQPCHENWQNMTPNEQGRFCGSCQKTVVDFSMMSDRELLDYISNVSGYTACGRFSNDQLNNEIKVTENKRRSSWAYVWNIMLATFLVTEANAQAKPKKKAEVQHREQSPRTFKPTIISINKSDTIDPSISTIGYIPKTTNCRDNTVEHQSGINPLLELQGRVGGYVVVERTPIRERVSRVINNLLPAALKKDVLTYPNPVIAGNYVTVMVNLPAENLYKLEVLSFGGQVMHVQYFYIQTNDRQVVLATDRNWNTGVYWTRITSLETKKVYQSKLIVKK